MASLLGVSARRFTLVIDAGHGGKDPGSLGAVTKEKNLTLKYALAFGKMVERNCPDVNVVYTRKTDRFLELWQRAEIANKNKADLFISVHINSLPKGRVARGFQTYTLGKGRNTGKAGVIENLEVAKRENAVILQEENYKQKYMGYDPNSPESDIFFEFVQEDNLVNSIELAKQMQRYVCAATGRQNLGAHQDNLAVLRLTSMPGCLLELGFISTSDEEAFMNADSSLEKYARGMFNAFQAYRRRSNRSIPAPKSEPVVMKENRQEEKAEQTKARPDSLKSQQKQSAAQDVPAEPTAPKSAESKTPKSAAEPKQPESGELIFKVQFLTSGVRLNAGSKQFKGLKNVDIYKEGGIWKYTVGSSADYNEIYRLRKQVVASFPQAFIIAFRNGQKVDSAAAYQEFKNKRKK